ncbi:hypothetical protein PLESTB_001481600 [Pleodorina starrii]|uniref:EngB-type G domain-containing protein n=1 Tax=Pleodorina starrii TaxID=330485 RepID=A0A9W6BX56_9CHLO|nr:hypothetical protein PLESTM_000653100 [Pleodorina starrii]GLC59395.1 hypothetical protein PLESTB_001481600 [Pleodorina starrii]GLC74406.1 hypothetical protein PLESTF_001509700 [Pleodorina starrii]
MQALLERALSGRSACCSTSITGSHVSQLQLSRCTASKQRAAAVVVAASVPSRSGKGRTDRPGQGSKKSGSNTKGKQLAKASPPSPKPQRPSKPGQATVKPARKPTSAGASPKLPRPATHAGPSTPVLPAGSQPKLTAVSAATSSSAASLGAAAVSDSHPCDPAPQGSPAPQVTLPPQAAVATPAARDPDHNDDVGGDDDGDGFLVDDGGDDSEEGGRVEAGGEDAGDDDDDEEAFPEIQFSLPNATNVKVKTAEYLKSSVAVADCPPPRFAEFAVIGRSNVGKSSLINMLTGRKDLALVSKQPGKTKCINHFLINGSWYLVDLPGYGFAKVGLQGRQQFDAFTREYFKTRPNLAMVFMLVDASIPPQKIDVEYANWLTDNEVPFTLVFTKADKRRKGVPASAKDSHVTAFKRALLRDLAFLPPSILTSAAKGLGRGEMLNFMAGLRIAFEKSGRLAAIKQGML